MISFSACDPILCREVLFLLIPATVLYFLKRKLNLVAHEIAIACNFEPACESKIGVFEPLSRILVQFGQAISVHVFSRYREFLNVT